MKRQLIAVGVAVAAPLLGIVAMTAATAAVAHAVMTGTITHRSCWPGSGSYGAAGRPATTTSGRSATPSSI